MSENLGEDIADVGVTVSITPTLAQHDPHIDLITTYPDLSGTIHLQVAPSRTEGPRRLEVPHDPGHVAIEFAVIGDMYQRLGFLIDLAVSDWLQDEKMPGLLLEYVSDEKKFYVVDRVSDVFFHSVVPEAVHFMDLHGSYVYPYSLPEEAGRFFPGTIVFDMMEASFESPTTGKSRVRTRKSHWVIAATIVAPLISAVTSIPATVKIAVDTLAADDQKAIHDLITDMEVEEHAGSVRTIQLCLKRLGYPPGLIDGQLGPRTRDAIKDYLFEVHIDANLTIQSELFKRRLSEDMARKLHEKGWLELRRFPR